MGCSLTFLDCRLFRRTASSLVCWPKMMASNPSGWTLENCWKRDLRLELGEIDPLRVVAVWQTTRSSCSSCAPKMSASRVWGSKNSPTTSVHFSTSFKGYAPARWVFGCDFFWPLHRTDSDPRRTTECFWWIQPAASWLIVGILVKIDVGFL